MIDRYFCEKGFDWESCKECEEYDECAFEEAAEEVIGIDMSHEVRPGTPVEVECMEEDYDIPF